MTVRQETRRWLVSLAGVVLLAAVVGPLIPSVADQAATLGPPLLLSFGLIGVCLAAGGRRLFRRRSFDPFHPLVLLPTLIALYYGVRGVFIGATLQGESPFLNTVVSRLRQTFLIPALLVALLGVLAFIAGFLLPFKRTLSKALPRRGFERLEEGVPWRRVGVWLFAVGGVGHLTYFLRLRGVTLPFESGALLESLTALSITGLALIVVAGGRAGGSGLKTGLALWVSLSAIHLAVGYRFHPVAMLVGVLVGYQYGVGLRRPRLVALVLIFAFVAFPLVSAARLIGLLDPQASLIDRIAGAPGYLLGQHDPTFLGKRLEPGLAPLLAETANGISFRLYGTDTLIAVVGQTPDPNPFIWRERLSTLAQTVLVPRLLWQGKPGATISDYFKARYWGSDPGDLSAQKPGLIGDLYMQAGLIAVMLGMLAVGLLCGAARSWFESRRHHPLAVGLYAIIAADMLFIEDDTVLFASKVVFHLAMLWVLVWLVPVIWGRSSRSGSVQLRPQSVA